MADHIDLLSTIALLGDLKKAQRDANKAQLEENLLEKALFRKERSVYVGSGYAMRFSEANKGSFSNVVLSLSALQKYDVNPLVISIVRPERLDFVLANATFLRRISHSSHNLRMDNIRGSFLGHDIIGDYEGILNRPDHFDELMAIHAEFTWEENVERLVELPTPLSREEPDSNQPEVIFRSFWKRPSERPSHQRYRALSKSNASSTA